MLGIDTNVLIRYLTRDDELQFAKVQGLVHRELTAGRKLLVSHLVLMEAEWVLRSRYRMTKAEIAAVYIALLESTELQFDDESSLEEALHLWGQHTAGFADCLIAAKNRRLGCDATATFDVKAGRVPGFELIA